MVAVPSSHAVFCRLNEAALDDIVAIELESNPSPWSRKLFAAEFSAHHSLVFGSRFGGMIIGYIVVHVVIDEAHIMNFGMRTIYRGQGFGRALLTETLLDLNRRGVRWVTLEVRRSNIVAASLYESLGFSEVGVREHYYSDNGEDALVLSLNMSEFMHRLSSRSGERQ